MDNSTLYLHSKDFNGVAIDDQLSVLSLYFTLEPSMGGVILEQVGLWQTEGMQITACSYYTHIYIICCICYIHVQLHHVYA